VVCARDDETIDDATIDDDDDDRPAAVRGVLKSGSTVWVVVQVVYSPQSTVWLVSVARDT
jgi:hypothetical protein